MKFKQYIETLQTFMEENPETSEYEVIYSKDAEGNGFDTVYHSPSKGIYEDREFTEPDPEWEDEDPSEMNAVCIN